MFFVGQEVKENLNARKIYKALGLDKKNMRGKTMYNRLRYFLYELVLFNKKHQEMDCNVQKSRFTESLQKLNNQMDFLRMKDAKNAEKYENELRKTQNFILNRKVRIKNKRD